MQNYIYSFNLFVNENEQSLLNLGPVHQEILKRFEELNISWKLGSNERQLKNGTLVFGLEPVEVLRLLKNTINISSEDFLKGKRKKSFDALSMFYLDSQIYKGFDYFLPESRFWWICYPYSIKRMINLSKDFSTGGVSSSVEASWNNDSIESIQTTINKIFTRTLVSWPLNVLASLLAKNLVNSRFSPSNFKEVKNPIALLKWIENDMIQFLNDHWSPDREYDNLKQEIRSKFLEGASFTEEEINQIIANSPKDTAALYRNSNFPGDPDEWILGGW